MPGPFYEFVKVAFNLGSLFGGAKIEPKDVAEAAGKGAAGEAMKKAKPYIRDVQGMGLGALAGKALLRRASLGALVGLAGARHKDISEAAKKGYKAAKGKVT